MKGIWTSGLAEILLRLGVAVAVGSVLGIDRELRKKPAGLKTHALVALGASLVTVLSLDLAGQGLSGDKGAILRTIQGIITGIGFLGAGVILHPAHETSVQGLTTAASIWVVACLGIACGAAQWLTVLVATGFTLAILVLGAPLERLIHRIAGTRAEKDDSAP